MTLEVDLCGVNLKNPVIPASGTFSFGREFSNYMDLNDLGGLAIKCLTLEERGGNPGRRLYETPSGLMNSIGLQNPSVKVFIEEELPFLEGYDLPILANVGGSEIWDYRESVKLLEETSVSFIELNISCPNVKKGGMSFGIKADRAFDIVKEIRQVTKKPLIVKLSPNCESISDMALACQEAGADALSLVNTFNALAIDVDKRKPIFENVTAGLSGPAIKPIALRMVYEVAKTVEIPIIGMGGISSAEDALEFIMAGATCIQVGTANFLEPRICIEIIEGMEKYMEENSLKNLDQIRGCIL